MGGWVRCAPAWVMAAQGCGGLGAVCTCLDDGLAPVAVQPELFLQARALGGGAAALCDAWVGVGARSI